MQKIITLFLVVFCLGSICADAQSFTLSGKLRDMADKPVPVATVSLLKADSAWLRSEQPDESGSFQFIKIEAGNYIVDVQAAGYAKIMVPVSVKKSTELPVINLHKLSGELKEVTVSSKKPYMEQGLGKTIINLDQATTAAGSNVLELLRKSPGVVVDGNGNITMKGNGVLVLIDDKQTYLAGDQLADYLKSLSAEQVAQLELITQPPAKYDAEGNGGIINIKMRKSKRAGLNGNLAIDYTQTVYPGTHNSASVNYRKNKINIFANAGQLHATGFLDQHEQRATKDLQTGNTTSTAQQYAFLKETFEDYSLKTGIDYTANDKITMGAGADGFYHPNHEKDVTTSTITDQVNNVVFNNITVSDNHFVRDRFGANAYLKYQPKKDHELDVNADYLVRRLNEHRDVISADYDALQQLIPGGLTLQNHMLSSVKAYIVKADYAAALKNDMKLEAGIKSSFVNTDNGAYFNILQNNTWQYDSTRSNDFLYNENINAAYLSMSKTFGKKWQTQAGLRVENTNAKGKQLVNDQEFTRTNTDVFPTAYINYKANEKNSFDINYGIRIERPNYISLNPFITYRSQYNYTMGNPNLESSYRHFIELSYNYNGMLISSCGLRKITNDENPVLVYNTLTNAVYSTTKNNATKYVIQISETVNKQLFDWWLLSGSAELYYNSYADIDSKEQLVTSTGYSVGVSNQFSFKKGWSADTFYSYNSGMRQNLIEENGYSQWIGFTVSKKIWKDTAVVKLSVQDPFDMYRANVIQNWNGVERNSNNHYATQEIGIGFTYNFGKKSDSQSNDRNAPEESKRM